MVTLQANNQTVLLVCVILKENILSNYITVCRRISSTNLSALPLCIRTAGQQEDWGGCLLQWFCLFSLCLVEPLLQVLQHNGAGVHLCTVCFNQRENNAHFTRWKPEYEERKQFITYASLDVYENIHRTSATEKRICSCGLLELKGLIFVSINGSLQGQIQSHDTHLGTWRAQCLWQFGHRRRCHFKVKPHMCSDILGKNGCLCSIFGAGFKVNYI